MSNHLITDDVVISYKIRKIIKRINKYGPDYSLIYLSVPTIHPLRRKIEYVEVLNFYITLLENHKIEVSGVFKRVSELKVGDIISLHSSTFISDGSSPKDKKEGIDALSGNTEH